MRESNNWTTTTTIIMKWNETTQNKTKPISSAQVIESKVQKKQNAKPTKSILIKRLSGFIGGVNNEVTNITSAHTSTCHFCLRDVFDFYLARCCSGLMHFPFFLALDPCVSRDTCTLTIYLLIQSRSSFFFGFK